MSASRPEREHERASDTPSNARAPILVVDDNAAKRLALRAVLRPLGHLIVEADSGLAALRCVMADDFAVILLDVRMPIMDGFETAALIRKRPASELTPIIFITAYGSEVIVPADWSADDAVEFMFAPIRPDELRAKVAAFVRRYERIAQARRRPAAGVEGDSEHATRVTSHSKPSRPS